VLVVLVVLAELQTVLELQVQLVEGPGEELVVRAEQVMVLRPAVVVEVEVAERVLRLLQLIHTLDEDCSNK
jgi:uncharacterized cupin superfamily protein